VALELAKDELLERGHLVLRTCDHGDVINISEGDAACRRVCEYARICHKPATSLYHSRGERRRP
jgi:hypothetical protein